MAPISKTHIILFWILIFIAYTLSSCTEYVPETTGNLSGIVRESRHNEPLQGVSVTLSPSGKSCVTGTDGRYEFKAVDMGNYTVTATKTDYKSDSKTVNVLAGEDTHADFMLTPSTPLLAISQTRLDFGATSTNLSFDITNNGNAPMAWQINEDCPWLSCSPASGSLYPEEKASIVVNVSREGLERGNYTQSIVVSTNGGSETVAVNMSVQGISVSVSPEMLDFGSITTALTLTMINNGSGSISYSVATSNDWIKLNKNTGVFTSTESITVSVDRTQLDAGDYSGSLTVTLSGEDIIVPVQMSIPTKERPTVSLTSVSAVTYSSAVFSGAVVSIGSAKVTRHGFCWSTSNDPTVENGESCNIGDCTAAKDFTYTATSLEASTTYYVRVYAENSEGISYSKSQKFQTTGSPVTPTVETGTMSDIKSRQAKASGNIINLGNVSELTQHGHVWSTTTNPTTSDCKTVLGKTSITGTFNSDITGLAPETTYYVRAYATNEKGTTYGKEVVFTTLKLTNDIEVDKEGYGQDNNWNINQGSANVNLDGYGQDNNWNGGQQDSTNVNKEGYGQDNNWNGAQQDSANVNKEGYGKDNNWNKQ